MEQQKENMQAKEKGTEFHRDVSVVGFPRPRIPLF